MTDYPSSFNVCEIDLDALSRNYGRIVEFVKRPIMAVIKGDAYGHGLVPCAQALEAEGCQDFGVLDLEEAMALRRSGISAEITVLAGLSGPIQCLEAVKYGITVFAYGKDQLSGLHDAVNALKTKAKVWVKIDSGMGRLGFPLREAPLIVRSVYNNENFELKGMATHLPTNGDDDAKTQLVYFKEMGKTIESFIKAPLPLSALSSAGLICHPGFPDSLSRPGMLLYGYSPISSTDGTLDRKIQAQSFLNSLEPAMAIKSEIIQVRNAKWAETISYDRTHKVMNKEMPFATAPFGYTHGFSRTRSSKGFALIGGREAQLLGRVCMNLTMYDVTGIDAEVGDEVVLMGRQGKAFLGANVLGEWQGTNVYELLPHLGRMNPRFYKRSSPPQSGAKAGNKPREGLSRKERLQEARLRKERLRKTPEESQ